MSNNKLILESEMLDDEAMESVSGGTHPALQEILDKINNIKPPGAERTILSFTTNNLSASSSNTQTPETTYNVAQMAKEMAEFTKENIRQEAANSMLSQANQQPQGVLSLLQ